MNYNIMYNDIQILCMYVILSFCHLVFDLSYGLLARSFHESQYHTLRYNRLMNELKHEPNNLKGILSCNYVPWKAENWHREFIQSCSVEFDI